MPLRVEVVTYDFGNTLVRVDRASSRAVAAATASALSRAGIIDDEAAFLAVWAEERDRQFREEVPNLREVDLTQRVVRVLARLRGAAPPVADALWDDASAGGFGRPGEGGAPVAASHAPVAPAMQPR